jgi:cytochrome c-type biogenesis protein CcmH/NrfG
VEALRRAVAFVPTGWCEPYARMVDGYRALARPEGVAYATAMATFCNGRPAEAATVLETLQKGPFAIDAWLGLALVSAAQGDPQAAADFYGRVLALDPRNASALIGLGQLGGAAAHAGLASPVPSDAAGSTAP